MNADVPAVTVADLDEDAFLLDVREPDEWAAGHIEGAVHIPMAQLIERLHEVPDDEHVVAVCRVGTRSAQVTTYLAQQGKSVRNLVGGMEAWAAAGRPMVSETGQEPAVI